jgi:hypothetical protein
MPRTLGDLTHDHADLNQRVRELASRMPGLAADEVRDLAPPLRSLRDLLFLHFAREEEGLFPFVADLMPALADQVDAMAIAHDTICGSLSRMVHLASSGGDGATMGSLFARFEQAYAAHAASEGELFAKLDTTLDDGQRAELARLVRSL